MWTESLEPQAPRPALTAVATVWIQGKPLDEVVEEINLLLGKWRTNPTEEGLIEIKENKIMSTPTESEGHTDMTFTTLRTVQQYPEHGQT